MSCPVRDEHAARGQDVRERPPLADSSSVAGAAAEPLAWAGGVLPSGTWSSFPRLEKSGLRRSTIAATALPTAATIAKPASTRGQRFRRDGEGSSRFAASTSAAEIVGAIFSEIAGAILSRTATPACSTCGAAQLRASCTRGAAHATASSALCRAARPAVFAVCPALRAITGTCEAVSSARCFAAAPVFFLVIRDIEPPKSLSRWNHFPGFGRSTVIGKIAKGRGAASEGGGRVKPARTRDKDAGGGGLPRFKHSGRPNRLTMQGC